MQLDFKEISQIMFDRAKRVNGTAMYRDISNERMTRNMIQILLMCEEREKQGLSYGPADFRIYEITKRGLSETKLVGRNYERQITKKGRTILAELWKLYNKNN